MLIRVTVIFGILFSLAACEDRRPSSKIPPPPVERVVPFRCEMDIDINGEKFAANLFFYGDTAVEYVPSDPPSIDAVYYLESRSWSDFSNRGTVTMSEAERWAALTMKRSLTSLEKSEDDPVNRMAEAMLRPRFEVTESEGGLTLKNDMIEYRFSSPIELDSFRRRQFFTYERLSAYRKAMTIHKNGPFTQLAVRKELLQRGFIPGKIEIVFKSG